MTVTGPKGTLVRELPTEMEIKKEGEEIVVTRPSDLKRMKALHGLTRTLINNMVVGVTQGYEKVLEVNGVGYKAAKSGNKLTLSLGYSHPVEMIDPEGVETVLDGQMCIRDRDVDGIQTAEFGSSEGVIEEQIAWGKAGTPKRGDELILFEVTFCAGKGQDREAVTRAHALCDEFVQQYRECLKKLRGEQCTERREFYDIERPGRKKVVIVKQVAGQGAMYDMQLFAKEPSGMAGGRSIIDMGNMPLVVTPNEYRDGILRSMQ